jgi:peptidyl-prolyl cis-trans isomerase SurA
LKVGEWSDPRSMDAQPGGKEGYEILSLQKRTEPHVLDLVQDYPAVADAAEGRAKQKVIDEWVKEKLAGTWIRVIPDYASCPFRQKWITTTAP